jgi:formylmethanofuran dehydrogenase subunit A
MFELPRYVIKAGEVIVEDTELRSAPNGRTLHVEPAYDPDREADIAEWFEKFYSIRFRNYPVGSDYLQAPYEVPCRAP